MRPKHAQPSTLANFGWSTGMQWGACAVLAALAIGAAAAVSPTSRHAEAAVPPPVVVTSTQESSAATVDTPIGGLPIGTSGKPATSTVPTLPPQAQDEVAASSLASDGIPAAALLAYQNAARRERGVDATCGLTWPLLAGIGRVESDHGRFAGATLHADGVSTPRVIGIPLDGHGTARISDTDGGRLDGDKVYDRAVGSMQFIPSTWAHYGVDGNGDGVIDPFNIFDAAAAAADYLCAAGGDLTTLAGQVRAIRAYNNVDSYIRLVMQLETVYARGVPGLTVPIVPVDPTSGVTGRPKVPPVDPGPPLGLTHKPKKKPKPPTSVRPSQPSTGSTGGSSTGSTSGSSTGSTSGTPSETPCPSPSSSDTGSPTGSVTPTPPTTPPSGTSCPTPPTGPPSSTPASDPSTAQTNTASVSQSTSTAASGTVPGSPAQSASS